MPSHHRSVVARAFALALLPLCAPLVCSGCAAPARDATRGADPVGTVPNDLSVEIDVMPGRGVGDRAKIEERPARFVVLADGSLHGEADRVPPRGIRPARVRRLEREQMADLWLAMRNAGFASADLADTRSTLDALTPGAQEVLVTLEVYADGERYAFVRRYPPGGEDQPAMRGIVRTVAALAWSSDEALAESAELPLRYDLGADPYARYARPDAPKGAGQ